MDGSYVRPWTTISIPKKDIRCTITGILVFPEITVLSVK